MPERRRAERIEHFLGRFAPVALDDASRRASLYSSPASFNASVTPSLNAMMKSPGWSLHRFFLELGMLEQPENHAAGFERRMPTPTPGSAHCGRRCV